MRRTPVPAIGDGRIGRQLSDFPARPQLGQRRARSACRTGASTGEAERTARFPVVVDPAARIHLGTGMATSNSVHFHLTHGATASAAGWLLTRPVYLRARRQTY